MNKKQQKKSFSREDVNCVIDRYEKRYDEYGYSPQTLGWVKGKQGIRFGSLTSEYNFENKHILDIGCGFGDLIKTLQRKTRSFEYTGVELVEKLLHEARKHYHGDNIHFIKQNILDFTPDILYDYVISSGIFNFRLSEDNNYEFIEQVIAKALSITRDGLAFDFLSDKVDFFKYDYTFHSSPEKILAIAYKYSRNVILRNDYMPFEFSIFIFKDDNFDKMDTVFSLYKGSNKHFLK
jgi:SAM-dependent methyltransferase